MLDRGHLGAGEPRRNSSRPALSIGGNGGSDWDEHRFVGAKRPIASVDAHIRLPVYDPEEQRCRQVCDLHGGGGQPIGIEDRPVKRSVGTLLARRCRFRHETDDEVTLSHRQSAELPTGIETSRCPKSLTEGQSSHARWPDSCCERVYRDPLMIAAAGCASPQPDLMKLLRAERANGPAPSNTRRGQLRSMPNR